MSLDNQPFVSIVTPVYNTEQFLAECIESVLKQSYKNFEYIIVNNCSKDRSLEIARKYERQDSRIRVIDNVDFFRQIPNYNHALSQISPSSKYCKMVQADDWIFQNCVEEMVRIAENNPDVGIVSAYAMIDSRVYLQGLPYTKAVLPGKEACRLFLLNGLYLFGTPTSLLFRADLVRKRTSFFEENNGYFEDADVCFKLLQEKKFAFVHQVLTFTRRENESIMTSVREFNPFLLMELLFIRNYGRIFLSAEEHNKRMIEKQHEYFFYLGESCLRSRGKGFWEYHKKGMQAMQYRFSYGTLLKYAFLASLDLALNPKSTIERLINYSQRAALSSRH